MDQPYRAAPAARPVLALREVTAPLGAGPIAALVLLAAAVAGALVSQATELECMHRSDGVDCKVTVHRGLFDEHRPFDARRLEGASDPDVPLATGGIYYDPRGVWRNDERLADTAREFLRRPGWGYFTARRESGELARVALAASVLSSIAGLAWLLASERKTRWLSLSLDPNARTARARSAGVGGATLDRACSFGAEARLQRFDEPGAPHLPLARVVSADGASLPLLSGHAFEHRAAVDRLVERANRALAAGTAADRSPSLVARFAPSALLALALCGVVGRACTQSEALPATTGVIALTSSIDRCEVNGLTLLRGARLEERVPVGLSERSFSVTTPDGATRSVPVTFEVGPGRRASFDCARVRSDAAAVRFRATSTGVWRDDAPNAVPQRGSR